jgi:hypothetical protein
MYHIAPGQAPLAYIPENVARIEKEGWNVRHNYGDMEKLVASIEAVSAVREPLSVIFDTNRLVLLDGHRRHYALWLLREKGVVLKEVSAIVNSFGKGESYRSFEYAMLSSGSDKELLSIADKARLIDRHLKEDLKNGLTQEEAKAAFLENTGWKSSDYDATLQILCLPKDVINLLDERKVAPSTVIDHLKDQRLNLDEKATIIREAVQLAEKNGKARATGEAVSVAKKNFVEKKKQQQNGNGSAESSCQEDSELKPMVLKPTATEKAGAFDWIVAHSEVEVEENFLVKLSMPHEVWQEIAEIYSRSEKTKK